MKCNKCNLICSEKELDDSHDVPCYIFKGYNRKEKKNQADKYPRHWLCEKCHEKYEEGLRLSFITRALQFSNKFFKVKK